MNYKKKNPRKKVSQSVKSDTIPTNNFVGMMRPVSFSKAIDAITGQKPTTSKIPKPTYKNLRMMKSLQHDAWGGDASRVPKTTKKDTSLYNYGYEFGVKHWKSAPKQAPRYENKIYQGGRWEGQNVGKKINYKKPSLMDKVKKFFD